MNENQLSGKTDRSLLSTFDKSEKRLSRRDSCVKKYLSDVELISRIFPQMNRIKFAISGGVLSVEEEEGEREIIDTS